MNRIKELRKAHSWTQEELGKKLNLQKAAISKYETGAVVPKGDVLKCLSAIFKVSTDYLLGNEIERGEKFSDEETKLIQDYRRLDEDGKTLARGVISRLRGTVGKSNYGAHNNGSNFGMVGGNFSASVTIG